MKAAPGPPGPAVALDPPVRGAGTGSAPRRPRGRTAPARNPALEHLALDDLRGYRAELAAEESRVSYWRRLVQARLDLSTATDDQTLTRLRSVLSTQMGSSARTAIAGATPSDEVPPLPELDALWCAQPRDPASAAELLTRLATAESQLSAYRRNLHRRLDDATAELIWRYREAPALCLAVLPRPRPS